MHHPTDRISHTTAFVTPVVEHWLEREISQWIHPMKDRSDDPSHHERTLLPRSYILHLVMFPNVPYGCVFQVNFRTLTLRLSYHDMMLFLSILNSLPQQALKAQQRRSQFPGMDTSVHQGKNTKLSWVTTFSQIYIQV